MLQQTSLMAYREIYNSLGRKQQQVLRTFYRHKNLTNSEVAAMLGWSINRVTGRVFELRQRGLVEEAGKRHCPYTGRLCIAWRSSLKPLGDAYE